MQIRKGLNSDLARLEYCDFSFTVSQVARGPFINNDLKIETLPCAYNKTYELDIQTLENHCINPDAIFLSIILPLKAHIAEPARPTSSWPPPISGRAV